MQVKERLPEPSDQRVRNKREQARTSERVASRSYHHPTPPRECIIDNTYRKSRENDDSDNVFAKEGETRIPLVFSLRVCSSKPRRATASVYIREHRMRVRPNSRFS